MDEEQDEEAEQGQPESRRDIIYVLLCIAFGAGVIYALMAGGSHPILDFLSLMACIPYPLFEAKKRRDKKKSNKNKDDSADNTSDP
jgi:hypothetical protein